MSDKILIPHTITLENRNVMTVSGVLQVIAYDEYHMILKTDYGKLIIQGRNLVAGEISSSQNILKLTGSVEIIQYKATRDKNESILSRILK